MKRFRFIFALFFATASADCDHPLGFFAKFNDSVMPLRGEWVPNLSLFSYRNSSAIPTEFSFQDGYAFTRNTSGREYVGFDQWLFSYGTSVPKTRFHLNSTLRIEGKAFYSCKIRENTLSVIIGFKVTSLCAKVDIYLLPFDRKTGIPVKKQYLPKDNEKFLVQGHDTCTNFSDPPFYFLAKVDGKMLPLSTIKIPGNNKLRRFFLTRWGNEATKISFRNNKSSTHFGNVGFFNGRLVHGATRQIRIILDAKNKVQRRQFYACDAFSNGYGNVISKFKLDDTCFKVDIYLVQDGIKFFNDKETKSIKASEYDQSVSVIDEGEWTPSVSVDQPLVFYAKLNDNWYMLSRFAHAKEQGIIWFSFRDIFNWCTKVTFRHNYATTRFGNVGFYNDKLVSGIGINGAYLQLNNNSKIVNHQFYACKGLFNRFGHVLSLNSSDETCFKVDIYLKKYMGKELHGPWPYNAKEDDLRRNITKNINPMSNCSSSDRVKNASVFFVARLRRPAHNSE